MCPNLRKNKQTKKTYKCYRAYLIYLELPLQVSPHLNVFYVAFPIQPLLNLIEGRFERETFLDIKICE